MMMMMMMIDDGLQALGLQLSILLLPLHAQVYE